MKVLITGGAGFIGSTFARMLIQGRLPSEEGAHQVTVLDKLTYAGNLANLSSIESNSNFRFVQGDICNVNLLSELIPKHEIVINFAAESHVDRSIENPQEFILTNVLGVQTLLGVMSKYPSKRFIQVSTDEVYGSIAEGSWDEDCAILPNSPYAATKASADLLVRSFVRTFNVDACVTRCSNNYGPYQYPEKLIPRAVTSALMGKNIQIYGDGLNVREWTHVEDHCRGIFQVALYGKAGQIYNIPGGVEKTNLELAQILLSMLDLPADRLEFVEDRKGHDFRYAINSEKFFRNFTFSQPVDFNSGLLETVNWYKNNVVWWQSLTG